MRKTRQQTVEYVKCDGCEYVIGVTAEERALGIAPSCATLTIPWRFDDLEFHFHAPLSHRGDCFRYWAQSTHIMERTLKEREMSEDDIDEFMRLHLYREGPIFRTRDQPVPR